MTAAPLADLQRLLAIRDRGGINTLLADWLDRDLAVGDRWAAFAEILAQHGEWTLALRAVRRHRAAAPDDRARWFGEAVMLARAGRNAEARACIVPLLEVSPQDTRLAHFMGALSSEAGLFDDARRYFGTVLDADPRLGQTWLRTFRDPPVYPGRSLARPDCAGLLPTRCRTRRARRCAYALGKALDDIGDIDAALRRSRKGRHWWRPSVGTTPKPIARRLTRSQPRGTVSRYRISTARPGRHACSSPVFHGPAPRSSSTASRAIRRWPGAGS